jgi:hypothetical protein
MLVMAAVSPNLPPPPPPPTPTEQVDDDGERDDER